MLNRRLWKTPTFERGNEEERMGRALKRAAIRKWEREKSEEGERQI